MVCFVSPSKQKVGGVKKNFFEKLKIQIQNRGAALVGGRPQWWLFTLLGLYNVKFRLHLVDILKLL